MNGEIKAHKMQFEYELGEKDKRLKELQAQLQNINLEHDKSLERLQDELQESKDQIIMLKRHETTIEVYEKKMEEMSEIRADLTTAQKINKRLEADIAILESTQGKEHALQEMVTKLQQELGQAAVKYEMADLKLKEEKFAKKDAEERLRGYQDKETFYKNQLDKLNLEASQLSEELRITKATAQPSTQNDHEIARYRSELNQVLSENKMLKKKIEVTESKAKIEAEHSLGDALRDRALLDAKNRQLEQRLLQLETRLAEAQDTIGEQRQLYRESVQEVKRLERLDDVRVSHHTIVLSPASSARRNNPIEEEESPRPSDSNERTDTSCSLPMPEIYPILEERNHRAAQPKSGKRRAMGAQGQSFSGQRSNQPGQNRSRRCASKNLFDE